MKLAVIEVLKNLKLKEALTSSLVLAVSEKLESELKHANMLAAVGIKTSALGTKTETSEEELTTPVKIPFDWASAKTESSVKEALPLNDLFSAHDLHFNSSMSRKRMKKLYAKEQAKHSSTFERLKQEPVEQEVISILVTHAKNRERKNVKFEDLLSMDARQVEETLRTESARPRKQLIPRSRGKISAESDIVH